MYENSNNESAALIDLALGQRWLVGLIINSSGNTQDNARPPKHAQLGCAQMHSACARTDRPRHYFYKLMFLLDKIFYDASVVTANFDFCLAIQE